MAKPDFKLIDAPAKEFRFKLADTGRLYKLPSLGSLPMKVARRLVGIDTSDTPELLDVIGSMMDEYCPGLTEELTLEEFADVVEAWMAADGLTLGE